jgi:hypothetical protein
MPIHTYRCTDKECEACTENITMPGGTVPGTVLCKVCAGPAIKIPSAAYLDFNMGTMKAWEKEGHPVKEAGVDADILRNKEERVKRERADFVDRGMEASRDLLAHL